MKRSIEEAKRAIEARSGLFPGVCQSRLRLRLPGPSGRSREHPPASLRAQTGNPRLFGPALLHRLLEEGTGGNGTGGGAGKGELRSGGLDHKRRGFCPGLCGPFAAGEEDVTPRGGPGSAGGPAGKGGDVRSGSRRAGGFLRECDRGKARRDGSAGTLPRAGMWSMAPRLRWPFRGILCGRKHSRRIWKSASRRTRASDSPTCRLFARFWALKPWRSF